MFFPRSPTAVSVPRHTDASPTVLYQHELGCNLCRSSICSPFVRYELGCSAMIPRFPEGGGLRPIIGYEKQSTYQKEPRARLHQSLAHNIEEVRAHLKPHQNHSKLKGDYARTEKV